MSAVMVSAVMCFIVGVVLTLLGAPLWAIVGICVVLGAVIGSV